MREHSRYGRGRWTFRSSVTDQREGAHDEKRTREGDPPHTLYMPTKTGHHEDKADAARHDCLVLAAAQHDRPCESVAEPAQTVVGEHHHVERQREQDRCERRQCKRDDRAAEPASYRNVPRRQDGKDRQASGGECSDKRDALDDIEPERRMQQHRQHAPGHENADRIGNH